ncbi:MAG: hypothetical protein ABIP95_07530 [Pelobium sp.]
MGFTKFFLYFFLLVIISSLSFWSIDHFLFSQTVLIPYFWLVFGFMATITLLVYLISVWGLKIGGDYQSHILLASITIRLLLSMVFILIYTQKVRVDSILFITNFFSVYLLFTVFEIYCLLRNLRHQIKK